MTRFARPLLILCAVAALAACNKQPEPAKPAAPAAPAASAPATPPPAAPVAAATADSVGVPECDNYLTKYEACVSSKVPEAARAGLKQSLDQTRAAWRAAGASDAGKSGLGQACTQAYEAAKASLSAYGCTDF